MKLRKWNWDAQRFDEEEVDDLLIAEFMNWLRTTKRWLDDPRVVIEKLNALEYKLRDAQARHAAEAAIARAAENEKAAAVTLEGRKRDGLRKARDAKALKRAKKKQQAAQVEQEKVQAEERAIPTVTA